MEMFLFFLMKSFIFSPTDFSLRNLNWFKKNQSGMFKKSWRILIDLICIVSGSPFVESFIFLFWIHYFLKIEDILKKLKYYNMSHWEEELIPQSWSYITLFTWTGSKNRILHKFKFIGVRVKKCSPTKEELKELKDNFLICKYKPLSDSMGLTFHFF